MRLLDWTLLSASPMAIDVTDAGVFCTALWSCMRLVTEMRIWKVGVEKKSFSSHPKKAKTGKDQGKRFFLCVFFNDDSFGLLIFVQKTHRRQRWHMGYRVKKFQSTRPKTNIAPENSLCRIYFLYSDLVFSERLFVYISWTMFFFFGSTKGSFSPKMPSWTWTYWLLPHLPMKLSNLSTQSNCTFASNHFGGTSH